MANNCWVIGYPEKDVKLGCEIARPFAKIELSVTGAERND
jgi:hypothetical protein